MAVHTKKEIRDHLRTVTRLTTNDNDLIDDLINLTLNEINDYTTWTFNRRKTTFDTTATKEDYVLPRDLDYVGVLREQTTPRRLFYVPDEVFYHLDPNPSDNSGTAQYYRLWEEEGISTRLAVADTVTVVSSSALDTSTFTISVVGYDSTNGIRQSEVITLNGTTNVAGTITWAANRPLRISKSGNTTGSITITETSGATTLVVLGAEDRSPRFKVVGLYPIPDATITMYLEYFTRLRELVNDADVPDFSQQWHWVLREGALAKIYQHQNKLSDYSATEARYQMGLRRMKLRDGMNVDYIPHLKRHNPFNRLGFLDWNNHDYTAS